MSFKELNLFYIGLFCVRNLIKQLLISLIQKKLVVEGKKYTRDDILNSEKRRKIYEYVIDNPGLNLNRIANDLKITNYVVYWHLNTLLKFFT